MIFVDFLFRDQLSVSKSIIISFVKNFFGEMNSADMLAGSLVANDSLLLGNDSHFTTPEQCSTNTSCTSPVSPTGSSRVGFSSTQPAENDRVRFLTAKYPKHQMGLIRKRLAVEDWIDEELKKLFDVVCKVLSSRSSNSCLYLFCCFYWPFFYLFFLPILFLPILQFSFKYVLFYFFCFVLFLKGLHLKRQC